MFEILRSLFLFLLAGLAAIALVGVAILNADIMMQEDR